MIWAELTKNTKKPFFCAACNRSFLVGARLDISMLTGAHPRRSVLSEISYCRLCMQTVLPIFQMPGVLPHYQVDNIRRKLRELAQQSLAISATQD